MPERRQVAIDYLLAGWTVGMLGGVSLFTEQGGCLFTLCGFLYSAAWVWKAWHLGESDAR